MLKGRPRGGPPPERNISLAYISAPKLGRRPIGNEEATIDEVIDLCTIFDFLASVSVRFHSFTSIR